MTVTFITKKGQEIKVLADQVFSRGEHSVNIDASSLPKGMYVYRFRSMGFQQGKALIVQ